MERTAIGNNENIAMKNRRLSCAGNNEMRK